MAFASRHRMAYVHSRFERIMPPGSVETIDLWNGLFQGEYDEHESLPEPVKADKLRAIVPLVLKSWVTRTRVLIDIGHLHSYTNLFPETVSEAIELFQVRYCNPANIAPLPEEDRGIAMHVRRGLNFERNFTANRVTSDQSVISGLESVIVETGISRGVIFSGLNLESVRDQIPKGFRFDSEANEFEVIHHLITADVTILAKSCMSYISGAFAKGEVYYDPFFHPPLPGWKVPPAYIEKTAP
jgi:hypothetical protein